MKDLRKLLADNEINVPLDCNLKITARVGNKVKIAVSILDVSRRDTYNDALDALIRSVKNNVTKLELHGFIQTKYSRPLDDWYWYKEVAAFWVNKSVIDEK